MKVDILSTFTGYPDSNRPVVFKQGDTVEVDAEFADLIISKGLAVASPATTPDKPATTKKAP
jgi:hypothetical protein